ERHVLGHAVDAAEVAAVGDRDAQIADMPAERIDHGPVMGTRRRILKPPPPPYSIIRRQGELAGPGGADQAALTSLRKRSTSRRSASDSWESRVAASSTWVAAAPVCCAVSATPLMFSDTVLVPPAACCTLREISEVAAPCSSTAEAIVVATLLMVSMVEPMPSMAVTASPVACCMPETWLPISSVALAVWVASDLTSLDTTAKPLPASPARAASMVALSASRLVWPAM